jgi:tetratricopeptide (TPR) repeat protein
VRSCSDCRMPDVSIGNGRHSIARVCQLSGGEQTGKDPTNRGKLGTKRHIVVVRNGLPLAVTISGSNVHDSRMLEETVDAIPSLRRPHRGRGVRPAPMARAPRSDERLERCLGREEIAADDVPCLVDRKREIESERSKARDRNNSPILPFRTGAPNGCGLAYFNFLFVNHPDLGYTLMSLRRYQEALVATEKAITLDPTDAMGWNNKAVILYEFRRPKEALAAAEKAITLDSTNATAWNSKAGVLHNLRRYQEALAAVERAIALDPTVANVWSNKAAMLVSQRRYSEALAAAEKALSLDIDNLNAGHT